MPEQPTTTVTINRNYLIEPLSGPAHPRYYLDRFPDAVYNISSDDSVLIKFLYALLGPAGAGWIKKNYMDVRVIFEEHGLQLDQLEKFYGDPLKFSRNLEEIYDYEMTGLLTRSQSNVVISKDADYKNRVIDFLHAARLGGTIDGIGFAAKSAIGSNVNVIENYKYMFDQHGDEVLNLKRMGSISDTAIDNINEFIIQPNYELSKTCIQTIKFDGGIPVSGYFTLTYQNQTTSNGSLSSAVGTVSQSGKIVTGSGTAFKIRMTNGTININGASAKILKVDESTQTLEVNNSATVSSGTSYNIIYGGLFYNATSLDVLSELSNLTNIGFGNIAVDGDIINGFRIAFANELSGTSVDTIIFTSYLKDAAGNTIGATITKEFIDKPGLELENISSLDRHRIDSAIDKIKPVNSLATFKRGQSGFQNQEINSTLASSEYYEIIRYVTGRSDIEWPAVDSVYWIEKGVEKEAPRIHNNLQQHYQSFHTPVAAYGYSASTLNDTQYSTNIANAIKNNIAEYTSIFVGVFDKDFTSKLFGRNVINPIGDQFDVRDAGRSLAYIAEPPSNPTQSDYSGTLIMNGIYPVGDKMQPIVSKIINYKTSNNFWATTKRSTGESDYLEIDLGEAKAVNYLSFDISRLPIDIEIDYDYLSIDNNRSFTSITNEEPFPFELKIYFDPDKQKLPWQTLVYNFTDAAGNMILTRYIRIKFTRRDSFLSDPTMKWPVLVKNLRLGRNV